MVLALWSAAGRPASAAQAEARCRREFWVVDTRQAPLCRGLDQGVRQITYWKREPGRGLVRKSLAEFLAGVDPSLPTTVYVYGNAIKRRVAIKIAERLMDGIGRDVPAYRMILWSWPSEHRWGIGLLENVAAKASWSESQGYYLAWLVDQIDVRTPLSLVGHSLGGRTVAAALQGLATRRMAGYDLGPRKNTATAHRTMQAALLAGAIDNRWLWPGWRYGQALTQVDRILVTRNPNDRLLRIYSNQQLPSGVRALGMTGIPDLEPRLGDQAARVTTIDSRWAGRAHRWSKYILTPEAQRLFRPFFFYEGDTADRR
ncbi:MAG TPA: hypothetical protein VGX76_21125 [Pirellulales bacterium]|nr:hypothetical protein [Pirellulales bacterium]